MARTWLWILIAVDVVLLFPGFYMASQAVGIASETEASAEAVGIAVLFMALPVFCLAAPYAAWRSQSVRRDHANAFAVAAAPILYAAFLTLFLFWQ